ncbi:hypothetical protein TNIN_439401 [Trichonephila inaurata madagascariensis]|uniref:Uncharacterized protein n=1 Tax=Trichonephila inaurata madagascariensis TaxID=2747483 RepID=A0A8X6YBV0_9ARAC|nr:hypothetical protein TNIN_439401 [Trichonephila inaurata madagascariensis]
MWSEKYQRWVLKTSYGLTIAIKREEGTSRRRKTTQGTTEGNRTSPSPQHICRIRKGRFFIHRIPRRITFPFVFRGQIASGSKYVMPRQKDDGRIDYCIPFFLSQKIFYSIIVS